MLELSYAVHKLGLFVSNPLQSHHETAFVTELQKRSSRNKTVHGE